MSDCLDCERVQRQYKRPDEQCQRCRGEVDRKVSAKPPRRATRATRKRGKSS